MSGNRAGTLVRKVTETEENYQFRHIFFLLRWQPFSLKTMVQFASSYGGTLLAQIALGRQVPLLLTVPQILRGFPSRSQILYQAFLIARRRSILVPFRLILTRANYGRQGQLLKKQMDKSVNCHISTLMWKIISFSHHLPFCLCMIY